MLLLLQEWFLKLPSRKGFLLALAIVATFAAYMLPPPYNGAALAVSGLVNDPAVQSLVDQQ